MSHPVSPVSSTAVSLALRPTTSDFQPPPPPPPFETLSLATPTPSLFRRFTAPVLPASVLHNLRHPHNYVARDPTRETYTTTSTPTTNSPETETEGWSPSPFEASPLAFTTDFSPFPSTWFLPSFLVFRIPFYLSQTLPFALPSFLNFLSLHSSVYILTISIPSSKSQSLLRLVSAIYTLPPHLIFFVFLFYDRFLFFFSFFLLSFVRSGRTSLCFESLHNSVSPFSFFLSSFFFLRFFTFSP